MKPNKIASVRFWNNLEVFSTYWVYSDKMESCFSKLKVMYKTYLLKYL